MNSAFTEKAENALNSAQSLARELGHTYVGSEHILMGLLSVEDSVAYGILKNNNVELSSIREQVSKAVGTGTPSSVSAASMTPMTKRIIEESAYTAKRLGSRRIGTEHILAALLSEGDCFAVRMIKAVRASVGEIRNELSKSFGAPAPDDSSSRRESKREEGAIGGCPVLSKYGRDLCRAAREGRIDPIIGRERETERVIQILSRRTKNNPCLIGEPGVGKTAVVEGLAKRIADGGVPEDLRDKLIVTLDISSMIAGAKYRGEFEERMKSVMEEVGKARRIILFVDEIHTIIGAGGAEGAVDAANIIKPALARGQMQLIGATTVCEYRRYIEKDSALERRFQPVSVGEPSAGEALEILRGLREKYEEHHGLSISDGALEAAVRLSVRYISDRFLPDKAIDLIDEAASKKRIRGYMPTQEMLSLEEELKKTSAEKEEAILGEDFERAARLRDLEKELSEEIEGARAKRKGAAPSVVTEADIEDIVTAWTGIPVSRLSEGEGERLQRLDERLRSRVIGQEMAVDSLARAVRRARTGLKDPKRPAGSFIFLGPTGVGKTELTKALACEIFGSEGAMIRLDMSDYMEKHSVSKLIGSPPGYVGYEEGGQLTERVRRRPFSVVLFDEIEKAHPDVFNLLLQILDDGMLTDSAGRRVDFKNTFIIMTSNVGARSLTGPVLLGFSSRDAGTEDMKVKVTDALKETFRPELLNRIDEVIVFNKLSEGDIRKIAALMLSELSERIAARDISVEFDESVADLAAKEGFDPVYGARPLRRAIVRLVEDSFSEAMLSGEIASGDKVRAFASDGRIAFKKTEDDR